MPAGTPWPGTPDPKQQLLGRLHRVEGQLRGISRMVQEDRYCIDVLTQMAAASAALRGAALTMLEDHLRHCLADASRGGGTVADEKLIEATEAIARLVRS